MTDQPKKLFLVRVEIPCVVEVAVEAETEDEALQIAEKLSRSQSSVRLITTERVRVKFSKETDDD